MRPALESASQEVAWVMEFMVFSINNLFNLKYSTILVAIQVFFIIILFSSIFLIPVVDHAHERLVQIPGFWHVRACVFLVVS